MSTRNRLIILLVVTLLLSAGLVYFIIFPTLNDIKEINRAILNERIDLEKKYLRGQLLRKTMADFEKIKPRAETLEKASLPSGQELNFITSLESIAQAHSVEQEIEIAFDTVDAEKSFQKVPLTLTINGTFGNIMSYIEDLERLEYYVTIASAQINTVSTALSEDPAVAMTLQGAVYTASDQEN